MYNTVVFNVNLQRDFRGTNLQYLLVATWGQCNSLNEGHIGAAAINDFLSLNWLLLQLFDVCMYIYILLSSILPYVWSYTNKKTSYVYFVIYLLTIWPKFCLNLKANKYYNKKEFGDCRPTNWSRCSVFRLKQDSGKWPVVSTCFTRTHPNI